MLNDVAFSDPVRKPSVLEIGSDFEAILAICSPREVEEIRNEVRFRLKMAKIGSARTKGVR